MRRLLPLLVAALAGACSRPRGPVPLVLLVSLDTTRADAVSTYAQQGGWGLDLPPEKRPAASTPRLDALAGGGVRFAWALAHAPTTLSSHTSVFSGVDAHEHTVVRNGFPVPPELPLLTERFAAAGWDTLAVVGSSTLDAQMRLDRGFRRYDDEVSEQVRHRYEDSADRVTDRVLALVDEREPGAPLFLFAHYFDAHSPWDSAPVEVQQRLTVPDYEGPVTGSGASVGLLVREAREGELAEADRRQARALYLAEVAWVDEQVGRLLDGLDQRGLLDDSLVVVMGDHGETLDEIPERAYGHGLDVDLGSIHVPLLMTGRGRFGISGGVVVEEPVRLMDIGTTVLSVAGLGGALGHGRDLSVLWRGGALEPAPSFAEATKPSKLAAETGWPNLPLERAVAADGYLLTRTPWLGQGPRLFRIAPGQPRVSDLERETAMLRMLEDWDARAPGRREVEMSPETREALRALGYVE